MFDTASTFLNFYGWLEEKCFAFYHNYLVVTAPLFCTHVTLTFSLPCCAVIILSALSASPSISCYFKWFLLPCITLHSTLLVVEKSLLCTCISSSRDSSISHMLYWHDRSSMTLMNAFQTEKQTCLSPSFFFSLFSISGVNVNKCQQCSTATTHLVHQPSLLHWWMISRWQAKGYYNGFRAKRNATALHSRCLFKYWRNHPQRWGENTITVLSWCRAYMSGTWEW